MKFTTDDYVKKDPEKAAKEAIVVIDHVAESLHEMVRKIDETEISP